VHISRLSYQKHAAGMRPSILEDDLGSQSV
jgi:hypothetical protein